MATNTSMRIDAETGCRLLAAMNVNARKNSVRLRIPGLKTTIPRKNALTGLTEARTFSTRSGVAFYPFA